MPPISVPFAPVIYKIVAGIPLLIFAVLAIYWGWKNLCLSLRTLQGKVALPPRSSPPFVVLAIGIHLGILAAGFGTAYFFLAMETTKPTVISLGGMAVGAGPPLYQQRFIPWREVTKVTCNLPPRENRIRSIQIYSHDSEVELGNAGAALEGIFATAVARAPRATVRPCEHGSLDHSWSY